MLGSGKGGSRVPNSSRCAKKMSVSWVMEGGGGVGRGSSHKSSYNKVMPVNVRFRRWYSDGGCKKDNLKRKKICIYFLI